MIIKELLQTADKYKDDIQNKRTLDKKEWNQIKTARINTAGQIIKDEEAALDLMFETAKEEQLMITENIIKKLYTLLYRDTINANDTEVANVAYRDTKVTVSAWKQLPPDPMDLPRLMEHFIGQINTSKALFHPIEFSAYVFKRFVDIHPFDQGNEKIACYLLNLILINAGYGITFVDPQNSEGFIKAFEATQNSIFPNMDPLVELIAECVIKAEKEYCDLLGI